MNGDKVKILVLGNSGVGKTSLVHLICHNEVLKKHSWTMGCSVDVKLHEFKDGTKQHKTLFIEFWDIGGSIKSCTEIFYSNVDGIILTHDLSNRKTLDNLVEYINEIENKNNDFYMKNQIPIMLIGTKLDRVTNVRETLTNKSPFCLRNCINDVININCMDDKELAPGRNNSIDLAKFFNKVVDFSQSKESWSKKNTKPTDNRFSVSLNMDHIE